MAELMHQLSHLQGPAIASVLTTALPTTTSVVRVRHTLLQNPNNT